MSALKFLGLFLALVSYVTGSSADVQLSEDSELTIEELVGECSERLGNPLAIRELELWMQGKRVSIPAMPLRIVSDGFTENPSFGNIYPRFIFMREHGATLVRVTLKAPIEEGVNYRVGKKYNIRGRLVTVPAKRLGSNCRLERGKLHLTLFMDGTAGRGVHRSLSVEEVGSTP